jgi:hypothetical protein
MPDVKRFLPGSGEIMIEVDGAGGYSSSSYAEALAKGVVGLAATFAGAMSGMSDNGARPDAEVTIALQALTDGGFVIPRDAAHPGVTVRLTWPAGGGAPRGQDLMPQ